VFTFLWIALGYLLVTHGLKFWLSSFLMLSLASIYLTLEKTRHNLGLAIVVPLATCVVAYVVFLHRRDFVGTIQNFGRLLHVFETDVWSSL
jgi:hypothetical protein